MRRGHTLIELMIALAIVGVMAAASVPALGVWLDEEPTPPESLATLLRRARAIALRDATPVTVTIDPGGGRWLIESVAGPISEGELSPGVVGVLADSAVAPLEHGRYVVRFGPTGGAHGGVLRLREGGDMWFVRADRWTGEVSLHGS